MARFDKLEVLCTLRDTGMLPVFYHRDTIIVKEVLKACYEGGVRVFEFTNRGDFACEVFASLVKYAETECPEVKIGVGSIIDAPTAALYLQYGADFIVGPCFDGEIARLCNRHAVLYIPGCGTVTEIVKAQEAGCYMVKIFPAGCIGGPAFVNNISKPLPQVRIMATGAVEPTEKNLKGWFDAGVTCVGMGSQLFPTTHITDKERAEITDKCRYTLKVIRECRRR